MTEMVVREIGPQALSFEGDNVLIFFGPTVPSELKEFSIIHDVQSFQSEDFRVSANLVVDDKVYQITAIGSEAVEKMEQLGHVVVYFADVPDEVLPGAIYAEPHIVPKVQVGTVVRLY